MIVAKVAAVGPNHYGMDLQLPENAFRFKRWIDTRKNGERWADAKSKQQILDS